VTIRAKLYAAIALTVIGPLVTIAVALYGMGELGERFDEVQRRADKAAIARELKFGVTDVNGWQTAYGYDGGRSRARFERAVATLRADLADARRELDEPREHALLSRLEDDFDAFMGLDAAAYRELRAGREHGTRRILLGPEIERFQAMATTAEQLATHEQRRARATERAFDDARDDARRRLIAVALGAGLVVVLLLVTAADVARLALEGDRRARELG
jgi:methyl-accepting chemotaxis protein